MSIDATSILHRIADTLEARKGADPSSSYVAKLFSQGQDVFFCPTDIVFGKVTPSNITGVFTRLGH